MILFAAFTMRVQIWVNSPGTIVHSVDIFPFWAKMKTVITASCDDFCENFLSRNQEHESCCMTVMLWRPVLSKIKSMMSSSIVISYHFQVFYSFYCRTTPVQRYIVCYIVYVSFLKNICLMSMSNLNWDKLTFDILTW